MKPQHNLLSPKFEMPSIYHDVQLYLVKKLSTINNARAIFLMELRENTYIDISAHLYNTIAKSTQITSRSKLVVPNLIMRILHDNGVETPQHIGLMTPSLSINS